MGIISTGPGGPLAFSSASGGKVYAFNTISTTPQVVAPANTSRQKITFHNPHASIDMYVGPSQVLSNGSAIALTPTTSALGGCFRIFAGATLEISGECQGAWQAFSASSSGLPLTVMDSNT